MLLAEEGCNIEQTANMECPADMNYETSFVILQDEEASKRCPLMLVLGLELSLRTLSMVSGNRDTFRVTHDHFVAGVAGQGPRQDQGESHILALPDDLQQTQEGHHGKLVPPVIDCDP